MKKLFVTMLAAMVAMFVASPAMAQATRTWVSGVGDDVNPCSRTAPCKTFAGAISKTAVGGEINCLDPAGFGSVTINKSLTIDCTGTLGGVLASGTYGVQVNDASSAAGPGTARVLLVGLHINGVSGGSLPGTFGVRVLSARDVGITNSVIENFGAAGGACVSINSATQVRVTVQGSTLFNCDTGVSVATTGSATAKAKVYDTLIYPAPTAGITVTGAGNLADIKNVEIAGTPKSLNLVSGGVVNSYGDNVLNGTTTDAPTPIAKQ